MDQWVEDSIKATKMGFENSFKEQSLYNIQTQDNNHIKKILQMCKVSKKSTVMDLGTGSGYLAFELAKKYPDSQFIGLDVVEDTLLENQKYALNEHINNVSFVAYDGLIIPFANETFDFVTTRYALHHFPVIEKAFDEISRVLKKKGYLFISDPTWNEGDGTRFVDDYMKMKKDGHIKYYSKEEFEGYAQGVGLQLVDAFETEITFPRLKATALEFDEIQSKHSRAIIDSYKVKTSEDKKYIYITQRVLNLLFQKC